LGIPEEIGCAYKKVSRCAAVAWRRRNFFKNLQTQGNCGPRQELGAARIRVTLRAKLARLKGTFVRKNRFKAKVERGTRAAGTRQEGKMDRKDLGYGRQYLRLRTMGKFDEIYEILGQQSTSEQFRVSHQPGKLSEEF
jgi:hypothetical protein